MEIDCFNTLCFAMTSEKCGSPNIFKNMSKIKIKKQLLLAINSNPFKEKIKKVSLFGSYLNGKSTIDSDIDLLIEFKPTAQIGFFGLAELQRNLGEFTGKTIDISTPQSLSKYFRKMVLKEAEIIYEK